VVFCFPFPRSSDGFRTREIGEPDCSFWAYSEIQSRGHLATNLAHRLSLKGCSDNFAEVFSHNKLFVVIKKNKIINQEMIKIENY